MDRLIGLLSGNVYRFLCLEVFCLIGVDIDNQRSVATSDGRHCQLDTVRSIGSEGGGKTVGIRCHQPRAFNGQRYIPHLSGKGVFEFDLRNQFPPNFSFFFLKLNTNRRCIGQLEIHHIGV